MIKKGLKIFMAFLCMTLASCDPATPVSTYKLSFVADSTVIVEHQIKNGDKIGNLPDAPNKAGYSYVWQIENVTISAETVYNYGKDMTANALYSAEKYKIVFPDAAIEVTYGQKIGTLPNVPAIEGKTNGRWTIGEEVINSETVYKWTKNTSAVAKYDNVIYNLSFEGTEVVKKLCNGEAIGELPPVPQKTGEGASHYEGRWEIDGVEIKSDTKFNYFENKNAVVHYYAFKTALKDGEEIDICSESTRALFDVRESETLMCEVVDLANSTQNFDYKNESYKFVWEEIDDFDYVTFSISDKEDLSNPIEYLSFNNYVVLDQLVPGTTYYYTIEGVDGSIKIKSDVSSFKVKDGINFLNIDGLENCRDIATFDTQFEGKTIKKGMIYRNNNADNITAKGIAQATELLGIKTELDLREKSYWKDSGSYFGNTVEYKHVSNENGGVLYIGDDPDTKKVGLRAGGLSIKEELMVFTELNNYPVDIHCAIGRDRTGTLTMIIQGLLGMSMEDILCDYMSSLLTETAKIDKLDTQTAETYYSSAKATLNHIKNVAGENDLSKAIEVYLTTHREDESSVDLTLEQVQSIKTIMLEDVQ